jgi:PKD repeat protein
VLAAILILSTPVSADNYVGGKGLTTLQSGIVSGGVFTDAEPPAFGPQTVTKTFTLPATSVGNITWARLYVSAYCGHMQNDYAFTITSSIDGDGIAGYEQVWPESGHGPFIYYTYGGNDNSGFSGHGPNESYLMINDHETRVTSDYLMWYDVTGLISGQTVNVNVDTTGSYDGRIKVITLIAAYNDGDADQYYYWVNDGHDVDCYYQNPDYIGMSYFDLAPFSGAAASATFTVNHMASTDGSYWYYGEALDNNPPTGNGQGAYSGYNIWDVTSLVVPGDLNDFQYDRGSAAYFKLPLAVLVIDQMKPPVAGFAADAVTGTAPLTVAFTDQSANTPTSWAWDFDNNGIIDNTTRNPSYTYTAAGTYTVKLTAANAAGSDEETKTGYITVQDPVTAPVAAFSGSPDGGIAPLTVEFTDQSTNSPTSWLWNFGDGNTTNATVQNPVHTYLFSGVYNVTLTATNAGGSNTTLKMNYITAIPGPYAVSVSPAGQTWYQGQTREYQIILGSAPAGLAGYTMTVSLTSPGIADIASVTFPAWAQLYSNTSVPAQSVTMNAVDLGQQVYPGADDVLLATVAIHGDVEGTTPVAVAFSTLDTDTNGSVIPSEIRGGNATILPVPPPIPAFTASPAAGYAPLNVTFTDQSTGMDISTWAWDFENNGITDSTERNPVHTYTAGGSYSVNLTATNIGGSNSTIKMNCIMVEDLPADSYTVSVVPQNQTFFIGETEEYQIVLTNATGGLAGYGITVALENGSVASLTGVTFPSWALLHFNSSVPAQSVSLSAVDTGGQIQAGATDVVLATLAVCGDAKGMTPITVTVGSIDADNGYTVPPRPVNNGTADIRVPPPVAAFNANPLSGIAPLTVVFTDLSTNTPTEWLWDFGDGDSTNATEQNPVHTYSSTGTFNVSLSVANEGGSNTSTKTGYISVSYLLPLPGCSNLPTDLNHNGLYEDINGNGRRDVGDVVLFFDYLNWVKTNEPLAAFDFNGNGRIDIGDVIALLDGAG